MDVHFNITLVGPGQLGRGMFVECNGRVSLDCDRGSVRVVARAHTLEATAEIASEEDSQGWGGGAHYADLELELRPDEEVEGGPCHVDRGASVFKEKSARV